MTALLRVFDSTPFLLLVFTSGTGGAFIGIWAVVMRWSKGEQSWAMFPFIAFWSWAALSSFRAMKKKRETKIAERERLSLIAREVVEVGATLEEAVRSSRAHLAVAGHTRHRNLSARWASAEFDSGSPIIRILALDGRVTGFEVS